jgi:hypothetical protein
VHIHIEAFIGLSMSVDLDSRVRSISSYIRVGRKSELSKKQRIAQDPHSALAFLNVSSFEGAHGETEHIRRYYRFMSGGSSDSPHLSIFGGLSCIPRLLNIVRYSTSSATQHHRLLDIIGY